MYYLIKVAQLLAFALLQGCVYFLFARGSIASREGGGPRLYPLSSLSSHATLGAINIREAKHMLLLPTPPFGGIWEKH